MTKPWSSPPIGLAVLAFAGPLDGQLVALSEHGLTAQWAPPIDWQAPPEQSVSITTVGYKLTHFAAVEGEWEGWAYIADVVGADLIRWHIVESLNLVASLAAWGWRP